MVYYHVCESLPLGAIAFQMNLVYTLASYFFKVQFNIILESRAGCSKWSVCFMLVD